MKVKELIKALSERPQDAEVYYTSDGGLVEIAEVKTGIPGNEETKETVGDIIVLLE